LHAYHQQVSFHMKQYKKCFAQHWKKVPTATMIFRVDQKKQSCEDLGSQVSQVVISGSVIVPYLLVKLVQQNRRKPFFPGNLCSYILLNITLLYLHFEAINSITNIEQV
jgi:hypothetical protein